MSGVTAFHRKESGVWYYSIHDVEFLRVFGKRYKQACYEAKGKKDAIKAGEAKRDELIKQAIEQSFQREQASQKLVTQERQYLPDGRPLPLPTDTFEFFVKKFYLPLVKVTKSPTTVHSDNWRCEQLIEYFGKYKLCEISHAICVAFQESRKNRVNQFDRQESNASVNRIIEVLQRIFSVVVDFEVLGKNPAAKVSMLKETPRDRIMTYEEEARIAPRLNLPARRMLRLAVVIALNAGLRKSEILKLRKADLDFERELIIIRKAKTGNRYALMNSLVRQAMFWTVNLGDLGPDDLVFGGIDWIKDTWPQVCKEAKVSNLHFHDLRATYTTRMLENGFDAFTACDATGHKDIKTTAIYARTTSKRMREAVNSLADENLSQICLTIKNGCSETNRATA